MDAYQECPYNRGGYFSGSTCTAGATFPAVLGDCNIEDARSLSGLVSHLPHIDIF